MNLLGPENFASFLLQLCRGEVQLIDVRSEVEFSEGSIPRSLNSPILNTQERTLVGTAYKKQGPDVAIKLGHELVSGEVKTARLEKWQALIRQHPQSFITCFRGGLRSKITQSWLAEAGTALPRIQGGYKSLRKFLYEEVESFSSSAKLLVVTGATGSGKTKLMRKLIGKKSLIDLELAAVHRGSAFGGFPSGQPTQMNFENQIALQILELRNAKSYLQGGQVLIEDESRLIGRCVQPTSLFENLRKSPVVLISETIEQRVQNTYDEYVVATPLGQSFASNEALAVFARLQQSMFSIRKRLGGLRYSELKNDLDHSQAQFLENKGLESNQVWIRKLLEWYYDPMYFYSLDKRQVKVQFQGTSEEVFQYLLAAKT